MTTIVGFKENGRWHLAADSRVSMGSYYDDTFTKLVRTSNAWLSIAGDARAYIKVARQADPESVVELMDTLKSKSGYAHALVTDPKGKQLWLVTSNGYFQEIKGKKFYTLGSGGDYALGALEAGASIERAFQIVKKFDAATGGPIHTTRKWKV